MKTGYCTRFFNITEGIMERIKNWLRLENFHLGLKAQSELSALRVMINQAINIPSVINPSVFAQAVVDSELYDSALGGCCNISFYAVTNSVSEPLFVFGRFDEGIGYYSKHKKPIDLVSLLAVPAEMDKSLADALLKLRDFLCQQEHAEKIRQAKTKTEVYQIFEEI